MMADLFVSGWGTYTHTQIHTDIHRDTYTLTHTQTHIYTNTHTLRHKQHVSSYSSTDSPEGQDIQNLLNINPLHSQLNKKVGTHSHAMLVLNKVRQFIVIFLIMVLIGEKSGPIYFAVTKSTNVYASLFYGCMFYRLCLSFAHVEISTSYCLFKKLHETEKKKQLQAFRFKVKKECTHRYEGVI